MERYEELEQEFAKWTREDPSQMVVCSSGTAALHLALEALGLPSGSEVILPDFCMVACARAVTLAGLTPVFVDCDKQDLLMDLDAMEQAITDSTSAVMMVHTYGRQCKMDRVHQILGQHPARSWGKPILVVEDLAEAHGVTRHPYSAAACWSFYKNKIIHGEEGGAVVFNGCPPSAGRARSLRCLGFTQNHDFWHIPRGHNYRLANSLAGLILESLSQASSNLLHRKLVSSAYDAFFPKESAKGLLRKMPERTVDWVYDFRVLGIDYFLQEVIVQKLQQRGVTVRHGFKPLSLQPEYLRSSSSRKALLYGGESYSYYNAYTDVFYLPITETTSYHSAAVQELFATIQAVVEEVFSERNQTFGKGS